MLSVATGINPRYIEDEDGDWGLAKWLLRFDPLNLSLYALPLVYMMWEGSTGLAQYQCEQLLRDRFHRIDPALPILVDIDEVKKMKLLEDVAHSTEVTAMLAETVNWLNSNFWLKCTVRETAASNGNHMRGAEQIK